MKEKDSIIKEDRRSMPLTKRNYMYMAISGALIVIGFLLMLGGSSTVEEFNPDIFSTRRVVIGPLLAFVGFVGMGIGIAVKPSSH